MSVYKLTPDKTTKFQINAYGVIDFNFGKKNIYGTRVLLAENKGLTRSFINEILKFDDSREAYILEFYPHNSLFAVVFDKNDWKRHRNGNYIRQIKEMYCDDNGLKTICSGKGIGIERDGFVTPSQIGIQHENQALKELYSTDDAFDALFWLGSHNYLDFLIKYKAIFKEKGLFEQGLFHSLTDLNMWMISKYYSLDIFLSLLYEADKVKLRECGDLFEPSGEIIAYRGIPNSKEKFRSNRVSWTLHPGIAAFFAKDCGRRDRDPNDTPAVYKVSVPPDAIFFYTNDRNEQEVVIDPDLCGPIEELSVFPEVYNPNLSTLKVANL